HRVSCLCLRIVSCEWAEHTDASHAFGLLCMSSERPDHDCAAEKCDEVAPLQGPVPYNNRLRLGGGGRNGTQPGSDADHLMSALGQKRTCAVHSPMSALPPKATSNAIYGMSARSELDSAARSADWPSYFAVTVVGLPSSPTKSTRTLAGTLPLLNSWCW